MTMGIGHKKNEETPANARRAKNYALGGSLKKPMLVTRKVSSQLASGGGARNDGNVVLRAQALKLEARRGGLRPN